MECITLDSLLQHTTFLYKNGTGDKRRAINLRDRIRNGVYEIHPKNHKALQGLYESYGIRWTFDYQILLQKGDELMKLDAEGLRSDLLKSSRTNTKEGRLNAALLARLNPDHVKFIDIYTPVYFKSLMNFYERVHIPSRFEYSVYVDVSFLELSVNS